MAASRFVEVSDKEISEIKMNSDKKNTKKLVQKLINDILQIRLKYCVSNVILCSAHSKRTRPQYNALNKIYFKTPSLHILECCFARSLQARSLRSNKKGNP
jgi:ribosomal protein S7